MPTSSHDEKSFIKRMRDRLPPRVETWWESTNSSLWFLPTIGAALAAGLAFLMVYIDHQQEENFRQKIIDSPWLFGAGADGARGVLTAIAGSVITVVGTVFSITIVALQLASSQFTPRVLRQFTGDRVNQAVLATFIGTFTYSVLVLRTVRGADDQFNAFVPFISVSVAILLALVSVMMLILFIHHIASQMQVSYILHRAMHDTLGVIDSYFRDEIENVPLELDRSYADAEGHDVLSDSTGYLQHYDYDYLLGTAHDHNLTVRMLVPMGAFLNHGQPIARVWVDGQREPDEGELEGISEAVRSAFVTGSERTMTADLPLGVRQIADIAIKALSPSINDPTTATQAIDRLGEVLIHAGRKESPVRILYVANRPAVFLPRIGFDEMTYIAFTQIRHYGKGDLVVMLHLVRTIERVASLVAEKHQRVLERQLELVRAAGEQGIELGPERSIFVETVDAAVERLERLRNGERVHAAPDIMQVG